MLRAMKEHLEYLAKDDEGRFHLALREKIGIKAEEALEQRLKSIIVLMPNLISRIHYFWSHSKSSSRIKFLGGYILTNLYVPSNEANKTEWKLFGYLDDAYMVAKFYTTVLDVLDNKELITWQDMKMYEEAKFLKKSVREVIPQEALKIDLIVQNLTDGHNNMHLDIVQP